MIFPLGWHVPLVLAYFVFTAIFITAAFAFGRK